MDTMKMNEINTSETSPILRDKEKLTNEVKAFIKTFEDIEGQKKYVKRLQQIADLESCIFVVEMVDLYCFNIEFKQVLAKGAKTFLMVLYEACDCLLPDPASALAFDKIDGDFRVSKRIRLHEQLLREQQIRAIESSFGDFDPSVDNNDIPKSLIRRYSIQIFPEKETLGVALKTLGARQLGSLVSAKGIVTKVSTMKLQLSVAAYICNDCGHEVYNETTSKKFNPVVYCPVTSCVSTRVKANRLPLMMNNRRSRFRKYQELTLQELPQHTSSGHIPQQMKIIALDENTMQCKGGDTITVTGILVAEEIESYQARVNGNKERVPYLEACSIFRHSRTLNEISNSVDIRLDASIDKLALEPNIFEKLASSIAPEIFGMLDVKKALLLQLVSGNLQYLDDGLRLRGDLNVCMVGDPGVAKSQLLKTVARMSPRAVYTTGKGSSAVGLTASVNKDKYSGEMVLEPGALVLADGGICCIDEFDKMTESDRTAIHEVMEQQTVSIAKAGVTTTLNARTSILAAANPVFGRYNRKLSPAENMNLPAALLSRFDLIFILLDTPNMESDKFLADHITKNYGNKVNTVKDIDGSSVDINTLRAYISQAKGIQPVIPKAIVPIIVEEYVTMRKQDRKSAEKQRKRELLTPRQLLSILRLSHALAKIRLDSKVSREDVQEAMRLVQATSSDLYKFNSIAKSYLTIEDVYDLIKQYVHNKARYKQQNMETETIAVHLQELKSYALNNGATAVLFKKTIECYIELNIWRINESGETLLISC